MGRHDWVEDQHTLGEIIRRYECGKETKDDFAVLLDLSRRGIEAEKELDFITTRR